MKNVVLLGSTGSIGASAIKVAEDLPDRIRLIGLAAGGNAELLAKQTLKHRPEAVSISDPTNARALETMLGTSTRVYSGEPGLLKLATLPAADIVLIAIVGTAGSVARFQNPGRSEKHTSELPAQPPNLIPP